MLEAPNTSQVVDTRSYSATLQQEMATNSHHAAKLLRVQMQSAQSHREESVRQQLESMLMHAERAVSNEEAARTMSRLFSKFSLLQKIMQSMG
jgi:hypothetical protein